jgi:hypothetical protein
MATIDQVQNWLQSKLDGKKETIAWIRENFPIDSSILDVGAGVSATYSKLLPEYTDKSAVEVFTPSAERITKYYNKVYNINIVDFDWTDMQYDLIIFGDVIEHLTIEDAQNVLKEACNHCKDLIVAVPFMYKQGECYGNKAEIHIQDDLTRERMMERYGDILEILVDPGTDYCYYHKKNI